MLTYPYKVLCDAVRRLLGRRPPKAAPSPILFTIHFVPPKDPNFCQCWCGRPGCGWRWTGSSWEREEPKDPALC